MRLDVPPGARHLLREDGAVVVPAALAGEVLRILLRDLGARVRADGGELTAPVRALLWALHTAATEAEPPASSAAGTPPTGPGSVEVTAAEAAGALECSPEYARRLARTGKVAARRAGTVWLIDRASLDAFRTNGEAA